MLMVCRCRLLVVLHKQHGQPSLLRAMQRKLPSNLLAHPAVSLVEPQKTHIVVTSSDLEHNDLRCHRHHRRRHHYYF